MQIFIHQVPDMIPRCFLISMLLALCWTPVGNAVKLTRSGRVGISVTTDDCNTIRFAVKDTGAGIAPKRRESIFEPFVQLPGNLLK